jgi:hypothetical protein
MAECLPRVHPDARSKRSAPNPSVTAFAQTQQCACAEPRQPRDDRVPGKRSRAGADRGDRIATKGLASSAMGRAIPAATEQPREVPDIA